MVGGGCVVVLLWSLEIDRGWDAREEGCECALNKVRWDEVIYVKACFLHEACLSTPGSR